MSALDIGERRGLARRHGRSRTRYRPALFTFQENLVPRLRIAAGDREPNELAVHVAVRLDARDGLLPDVAALVLRDEASLAESRFVRQDGLRQLETPAGDAGGDSAGFHLIARCLPC